VPVLTLRHKLFLLTLALFSAYLCAAAVEGSFRGRIVRGEVPGPRQHQWIYLQAGPRAVRLVNIASASVRYSRDIPAARRLARPVESLVEGAEVEVKAVQDDSGEWKATSVQILALAGK
jgi:hypothetical protein